MTKNEINKNLIFLMKTGSQAYGTNTPESDIDYGGVCMPSRNILYGLEKFELDNDWVDENGEKIDKNIYVFNKAIELLGDNNPNMLDYLCAPIHAIEYNTLEWEEIQDNKSLFISQKTYKSYLGYAISQLARIETHRKYLLNPPVYKTRADFGLPETSIFPDTQYKVISIIASEFISEDKIDDFVHDMSYLMDTHGAFIIKKYVKTEDFESAIMMIKKRQDQYLRMIGSINGRFLKDEFNSLAKKELSFIQHETDIKRYKAWSDDRNPKRKLLEQKCGYDAKHASHCIRLLRMANEILSGKGINVYRKNIDADELLYIRNGNMSYVDVMEIATSLKNKANELIKTCTLPLLPDYESIKELQYRILDSYLIRK